MEKFLRSILGGVLFLGLPLLFSSCNELIGDLDNPTSVTPTPTPAVAVTSITLDPTTVDKKVGDAAVTLTPTVLPDDATDKSLTWTSSKETVATVADGVVTFVGAGTATITATANDGSGVEATCTVIVLPEGALAGQFSVSATKKVLFSQGNLQGTYNGTSWTWAFAENQWDYIGNATGNTKVIAVTPFISENATVDLFGWVGASSTWDGVNQYGITSSNATNAKDGYGDGDTESLKSDWGKLAISNGGNTANSGWRTLKSTEWTYLFETRSASTVNGEDNARYAKAKVNDKYGVIFFPDSYTHPDGVTLPTGINATDNTGWTGNSYSVADWAKMEGAGAVFLPAAGYRGGSLVDHVDTYGYYWSSSPNSAENAFYVYFISSALNPASNGSRRFGYSVRLVRDAE